MSRLSLVIADLDRDYLSKLEKFLMVQYPQRFDLYSFSSHGKLAEFLNRPEKRDILLINSILFKRELNLKNVEAAIVLKGDGLGTIPDGVDSVNKYQHAETLVTEILRIYSARNRTGPIAQGRNATRIIGVFSAAGGEGKSSIAAGCSILCARRGMKSFYLNLERIPVTELFFSGDSPQSFSNVIYHLKGSGGNLGLKLEGAKCCDSGTGVYFFPPPENVFEMNELTADDISRLIQELKACGLYDAVFIDMPSGLDERTGAMLRNCDITILVMAGWDTAVAKRNALQKGMEITGQKGGTPGFQGKLVSVANRCRGNLASEEEHYPFFPAKPDFEIAEYGKRSSGGFVPGILVRETSFLSGLNKLTEFLFPRDEQELLPEASGGGSHA